MISVKELKEHIDGKEAVFWKGKKYIPTQYTYGWVGKEIRKMVLIHPKKNELENYWVRMEELTNEQ